MSQPFPRRLSSPGGEIVMADESGLKFYDDVHYAPARRAGDYVYLSGAVIPAASDGPRTPETFRQAAHAAFARISAMLAAFDLTFDDVVMMNSFHDWTAPEFDGDRGRQFEAFVAVKDEIMTGARPAWTAVGTSGLVREDYIVEVQMIAYVRPERPAQS